MPLLLCAALAWLVFVVLHRVLSGQVWWWQAPELLPPLALAAVPVLLLAAALARARRGAVAGAYRTRRVTVAAALISLTLGAPGSGLNLAWLWHPTTPAPLGAIKLFSWNTWYWDQPATTTLPPPTGTPPQDVTAFYRHLHAQDADVLLLQEYVYFGAGNHPIRVNDLDRLRREFPGHHLATAGEMVTLSRYPIVQQHGIEAKDAHVPPGSSWPAFHTTKTLRTDLRIAGRTVSVYNTHINSPLGSGALNRAQHEDREANLRALAADIRANPLPAVLAGDFNASPAMGLLRLVPERMTDATPALRSLYPATWDERSALLSLWRIDWAYTTPEIAVHEYGLVRSDGLSDHSGQRLVLSLTR
ncbi:endonuclease/exonuclease/phosphatase family protein [Nonomuraea monospora]|uniref:endonuclease/exonuclease/phosphatase family protein n=1 Tax=Nonomuraea monospora TaxID=568818 RepID=UPI0031E32944